MAYKKGEKKTVNYDFDQHQPARRMGEKDFASLPEHPIMRPYSKSQDMRSGVINNFSCGLEEETGIWENRAE